MPGFTTHYLFGIQTLKHLDDLQMKKIIKKNYTAFSLGLQGPDLFFYEISSYVFYKTNIGSVAHTTDTGNFLSFLLKSRNIFSDKKDISIANAYIAGFFGHYLLDTACHPYVYAISGNLPEEPSTFGAHVYLETDIDTAFLWNYKKMLPSEFRQERTIHLTLRQRRVIATILHYCYENVYPRLHVSYATTYAATLAMPFICRMFHDPAGQKKALARKGESILLGYPFISPLIPSDSLTFYKDPLNQKHRRWANPWDTSLRSTASFPELFEQASQQYVKCLADLHQLFSCCHSSREHALTEDILTFMGNKSYHSGLDCSMEDLRQ